MPLTTRVTPSGAIPSASGREMAPGPERGHLGRHRAKKQRCGMNLALQGKNLPALAYQTPVD